MRRSRFSKEKRLLSTGVNYENTGFGQLPERYVSNRKLISEGTGWKILLLGLGILVVGIVFGVVLPVVGILPVIHFKAAEQDPKQGILVICQLIFMIVVVAILFLLLLIKSTRFSRSCAFLLIDNVDNWIYTVTKKTICFGSGISDEILSVSYSWTV